MKHAFRMTLALALGLAATHAPTFAADLMQYGRAYLAEGDHAAAAKSYAEVVRLNPFDPVAQNNLAVARAAAGDYQSALELLNRAVKLAPNRTDIRENLTGLQGWMASTGGVTPAATTRPQAVRPVAAAAVLPEPPGLWGPVRTAGSSTGSVIRNGSDIDTGSAISTSNKGSTSNKSNKSNKSSKSINRSSSELVPLSVPERQ
jgi:tetratricopeptide (TPR) repeat protein